MTDSAATQSRGNQTQDAALDFFSAALEILRTDERPLTSGEIVQAALSRGLIRSSGRTPQKTMEARLYLAIRDDPECPVERIFEPGALRARRGSVRWRLKTQ
jgi:hypothetical protein